eukprot:CAMPEP_0182923256 /NCGR_PEP_ID=MMETSP0105_2-20130417/5311_1 /TAXON_ID=81532 ORGANISM="Acanthoeca-like sp., Strain 10tr" /NCGR_SAMPLE_ID=MMETSP0105_2 /ASSEMBLY_ACC=CAM_ASM_000205 /LENGTH=190 /DNA_ID=CAMNT_0025060951 /DNA_START=100 /DNA_END=673 /DNA_ORIENTATION=+
MANAYNRDGEKVDWEAIAAESSGLEHPECDGDEQDVVDLLGQNFTMAYYETFQDDRTKLAPLYTDISVSTISGKICRGVQEIMNFITQKITFEKLEFDGEDFTIDSQLTHENDVLVTIMGRQMTDDDPVMAFTHTVLLKQTDMGDGASQMSSAAWFFMASRKNARPTRIAGDAVSDGDGKCHDEQLGILT